MDISHKVLPEADELRTTAQTHWRDRPQQANLKTVLIWTTEQQIQVDRQVDILRQHLNDINLRLDLDKQLRSVAH
jgi:hypothetical protein